MLIHLLFGRIDCAFTTVEIGVCECNPDSFRDCPSATVTCPSLLMWANTSQYLDTESASPNPSPYRNFELPTLPSPLRLRIIMVAA